MKKPPDVIYLQWHGADKADLKAMTDEQRKVEPRRADITWCEDEIFDTDVKYVRAKK